MVDDQPISKNYMEKKYSLIFHKKIPLPVTQVLKQAVKLSCYSSHFYYLNCATMRLGTTWRLGTDFEISVIRPVYRGL